MPATFVQHCEKCGCERQHRVSPWHDSLAICEFCGHLVEIKAEQLKAVKQERYQ
jgi:hypothetical protein